MHKHLIVACLLLTCSLFTFSESREVNTPSVVQAGTGEHELSDALDKQTLPLKKYKVAISDASGYPLMSSSKKGDKGMAWAILQQFATENNIEFEYVSKPTSLMQAALESGEVDFLFPDNPEWSQYRSKTAPNQYSGPIVTGVSSSFVRAENVDLPSSFVKKVAIPFGFSAFSWHDLIKQNHAKAVPIRDIRAILYSVHTGRTDAADVEYNIAMSIINDDERLSNLVPHPDLPNQPVYYHLSSIKHGDVILELSDFLKSHEPLVSELRNKYHVASHQEVYAE